VKLNRDQRKQIAEILGNISVAWFTAGIISQLFFEWKNVFKNLSIFLFSFIMFIAFFIASLKIISLKTK
jgi:hypothetical protein